MFLTFNFTWKINTPTRVTTFSAKAIDNIITNKDFLKQIHILDSAISGHYAHFLKLPKGLSLFKNKSSTTYYQTYN